MSPILSEDTVPQRERVKAARKAMEEAEHEYHGILDGAHCAIVACGFTFDVQDLVDGDYGCVNSVLRGYQVGEYDMVECVGGRHYVIASHDNLQARDAYLAHCRYLELHPGSVKAVEFPSQLTW